MQSISTYKKFAKYYDLYVGDFENDLPIYESFISEEDKILEVGCGTGRVLISMLEYGNIVTGIDISDEMLELARNKLQYFVKEDKLIIKNHDFQSSAVNDKYNKCFITFYTLNYVLDNPIVFLENIYQSLENGAILLADVFYPRGLKDSSILGKWIIKEFDNIVLHDKRIFKNSIETRIQVFEEENSKIEIETKRRYYSPLELKTIFEDAGFREIEFLIGYNGLQFSKLIDEKDLETNYFIKATK